MAKKDVDLENYFSNLSIEQLIRGAPIEGIEERSLKLCQEFIGGSWNNAHSIDDIDCKRLPGGLTNQLYRISLKADVERVVRNAHYPDEPTEVAVKLYQSKHFRNFDEDSSERLNDTIILTALSALDVCPKVYGIFSDGFIQQYIPHEQFGSKAQKNPELMEKFLHKLALVHNIKLPIRKHRNWLFPELNKYLKRVYEETEFLKKIHELNTVSFIERDLGEEIHKFTHLWNSFEHPPKFCNMDLLGTNILVATDSPTRDVYIIDFEYSGIGCRGYDLATFIAQWGFEPMQYEKIMLPDDDILDEFTDKYRDACQKIDSGFKQSTENSHQQIIKEIKMGFALYGLFFTTFYLQIEEAVIENVESNFDETVMLAEMMYKRYLRAFERIDWI